MFLVERDLAAAVREPGGGRLGLRLDPQLGSELGSAPTQSYTLRN